MTRTHWSEPVGSAVLVFVAGYLLWPPGAVYWVDVAAAVGVVVTWVAIIGCCLGVGYGVRRFTSISLRSFALGGLVAYLVGLALVEATMTPESPVHVYLYGFLLGCMLVGAAARESVGVLTAVLDRAARSS